VATSASGAVDCNVVVTNNTITATEIGIYFTSNCSHYTVANNEVNVVVSGSPAVTSCIEVAGNYGSVTGNSLYYNYLSGSAIHATSLVNSTISGNSIRYRGVAGVWLSSSNVNVVVTGNAFYLSASVASAVAILASASSGNTHISISGNSIDHNNSTSTAISSAALFSSITGNNAKSSISNFANVITLSGDYSVVVGNTAENFATIPVLDTSANSEIAHNVVKPTPA
jgi:hypothetical protein